MGRAKKGAGSVDPRDVLNVLLFVGFGLGLAWFWQRETGAWPAAALALGTLTGLLAARAVPRPSAGREGATHVEHPISAGAAAGLTVGIITAAVIKIAWLPLLACTVSGVLLALAVAWDNPDRDVARRRLRRLERWLIILLFAGFILFLAVSWIRQAW